MTELVSDILVLAGAVVVLLGAIGLLRFPDFYCRMHAAGAVDTLGIWLVLLGLALRSDSYIVLFKLLLIAGVVFLLSPVGSHALSRSALRSGVRAHSGEKDE